MPCHFWTCYFRHTRRVCFVIPGSDRVSHWANFFSLVIPDLIRNLYLSFAGLEKSITFAMESSRGIRKGLTTLSRLLDTSPLQKSLPRRLFLSAREQSRLKNALIALIPGEWSICNTSQLAGAKKNGYICLFKRVTF